MTLTIAWASIVVGAVLVYGIPTFVDSLPDDRLLALSVGGGAMVWLGAIWEDVLQQGTRDERFAAIHYRAGYTTMLALVALIGTLMSVAMNLETGFGRLWLGGSLVVALVVYLASVAVYRRRM